MGRVRNLFNRLVLSSTWRILLVVGLVLTCAHWSLSLSATRNEQLESPRVAQLLSQLQSGSPLTEDELARLRDLLPELGARPAREADMEVDASFSRSFIVGVATGSLLLVLGLGLGIAVGRRFRQGGGESVDTDRALKMFVDLFQFTNGMQGDVVQARQFFNRVQQIAETAKEHDPQHPHSGTSHLLKKLVGDNQHLQQRLDDAESTLKVQSGSLEKYLTEARTDGLTRLPNRRAFDDELNRRWAEFRRHNKPFCVLLIDVDHFKSFNDRFGHQAGDAVLSGVAQALQSTMRQTDLVARYGGEEFAVIVSTTGAKEAALAAERARIAIEIASHEFDGKLLNVTASCGIAQVKSGDSLADLVKRADVALYASKAVGRNAAHWHDGEQCWLIQGNDLVPSRPKSQTSHTPTAPGIPAEFQQVCDALRLQLEKVLGT